MTFSPFFHYLRNILQFSSQREAVLYFGVYITTATLLHNIMTLLQLLSILTRCWQNITYIKQWVANFCNKVLHNPNTFRFAKFFQP